jgi:hypothetical protein
MSVPDQFFTKKEQLPKFHHWRDAHKDHGFVFNRRSTGQKAHKDDKLHRASCDHVWSPRFTPCETWGKVCHHDLTELISWAEAQRPFVKTISDYACTNSKCFGRDKASFESQWAKSKSSLDVPVQPQVSIHDWQAYQQAWQEGRLMERTSETTRQRCEALTKRLKEHFRDSKTKMIACAVCRWTKPAHGFRGDIIHFHHHDQIAHAPDEGRTLAWEEAKLVFSPLCPRCHALIHASPSDRCYTIDELQKIDIYKHQIAMPLRT